MAKMPLKVRRVAEKTARIVAAAVAITVYLLLPWQNRSDLGAATLASGILTYWLLRRGTAVLWTRINRKSRKTTTRKPRSTARA